MLSRSSGLTPPTDVISAKAGTQFEAVTVVKTNLGPGFRWDDTEVLDAGVVSIEGDL